MPSIFIAEGEDELRSLFKELLESRGYEVIGEVKNGTDVVDCMLTLPVKPNLYIIGTSFPFPGGFEASQEILKHNPDARFLFMGGDEDLIGNLKGKNNMGLIKKPFLLSTFLDAVNSMLKGTLRGSGNGSGINLFCNE